jgi:hypothetical protein
MELLMASTEIANSPGHYHLTLQRDVVNAFLAASREGYFDALLALLAFDGGAGQSTETFG